MPNLTEVLDAVKSGNRHAAEQLLPLVYEELRRLAAARLSREGPDQSLQATDLVHEAYKRLVMGDNQREVRWNGKGHFFAAAAEAMRRILIEHARAKATKKRGGSLQRVEFQELDHPASERPEHFLALDEALSRLEELDVQKAQLVKLRFFAGLTNQQAACELGMSTAAADRAWAFARAWLKVEIEGE
ncbi:MAG: ECF-type sigma factor [Planctomycetota bacterium]